eukprot:g3820.t1
MDCTRAPVCFYDRDKPFFEFSNFYDRAPIKVGSRRYPSSEHYFHSQKFLGRDDLCERVRNARTCREAFDMVRRPEFSKNRREDWAAVKEGVMMVALRAKFTQYPRLGAMLLGTGSRRLVEHTAKDRYWGDGGDGTGLNRLGHLLMQVRDELRREPSVSLDTASLSIGALGALELGLAFKMSMINVQQMAVARKAADPKRAAAEFLRGTYYKSWSRAQLNNTEYAPMLAVLMLLIKTKAHGQKRGLTAFERVSCAGAVAATCVFVYAAATQGKVDVKNMRPGTAGMSPLRPVGAMGRYFFMACLIVAAVKP